MTLNQNSQRTLEAAGLTDAFFRIRRTPIKWPNGERMALTCSVDHEDYTATLAGSPTFGGLPAPRSCAGGWRRNMTEGALSDGMPMTFDEITRVGTHLNTVPAPFSGAARSQRLGVRRPRNLWQTRRHPTEVGPHYCQDSLEVLYEEGAPPPKSLNVTLHAHLARSQWAQTLSSAMQYAQNFVGWLEQGYD